jgi:hypothetical protein
MGGSVYLPKFKGPAWITTSGYDVLRIETDLVAPIPNINLQREHQVIKYAPVEFPKRQVRLWLPESTSLYIAYRGRRCERVHRYSQFQVFSVDSAEAVKEPSPAKFRNSVADMFPPVPASRKSNNKASFGCQPAQFPSSRRNGTAPHNSTLPSSRGKAILEKRQIQASPTTSRGGTVVVVYARQADAPRGMSQV